MGEIGVPHHTALHELENWQIQQIITGYHRRHRDLLSLTRWQTYYLMAAQCGGDNLKKSGINAPTDLLRFPWEQEPTPAGATQEEIDDLQALIDSENARIAEEKKSSEE